VSKHLCVCVSQSANIGQEAKQEQIGIISRVGLTKNDMPSSSPRSGVCIVIGAVRPCPLLRDVTALLRAVQERSEGGLGEPRGCRRRRSAKLREQAGWPCPSSNSSSRQAGPSHLVLAPSAVTSRALYQNDVPAASAPLDQVISTTVRRRMRATCAAGDSGGCWEARTLPLGLHSVANSAALPTPPCTSFLS